MDRQVYSAVEERVVDLLGKKRATPYPRERNVGSEIARGLDLDSRGGMASCGEQRAHPLCLP